MNFEDAQAAELWFANALRLRGVKNLRQETIVKYVKGGRKAYPKLYFVTTLKGICLQFWRTNADQIKDSSKVSQFGSALDERIKFTTVTFGNHLIQMTQCKETTLLKMLETWVAIPSEE